MRRWFKKLGIGLSLLFCCAVLLVFPYDFYAAWKFHAIYVGHRFFGPHDANGWVSYATHPIGFWWAFSIDVILTLVLLVFTVFLVWHTRIERGIWRKRKTRPPVDDAIRQPMSER